MSLFRISANSLKTPSIRTNSLLRAIGLPLLPTNFSVNFDGVGRAQVSWVPPLDIGVPIENYNLKINGSDNVVSSSESSFNFNSGSKGTSYSFNMAALGPAGYGPATSTADGTILGVVATGGTTTSHSTGGTAYKVHAFTGTSTLGVTNGGSITGAVKGGGGGGSNIHHAHGPAGGGGGGYFNQNTHTVSSGNIAVAVGGGGGRGSCGCGDCGGGTGGTSSLGTLISSGGGRGGGNSSTGGGQTGSTTIVTGSTTGFGGAGGTKQGASDGHGHGGSCYGGGGGGGSCTHGGHGCAGVVYVRYIESS
jgi:hypothetical protein